MIGYRFLPPAEEEMVEASLFYEAESAELGFEFLDDVQRVVDSVREHPRLGQTVGRSLRRALLRRFPFSLIYSEEGDEILVVALPTNGAVRATGAGARADNSMAMGMPCYR